MEKTTVSITMEAIPNNRVFTQIDVHSDDPVKELMLQSDIYLRHDTFISSFVAGFGVFLHQVREGSVQGTFELEQYITALGSSLRHYMKETTPDGK